MDDVNASNPAIFNYSYQYNEKIQPNYSSNYFIQQNGGIGNGVVSSGFYTNLDQQYNNELVSSRRNRPGCEFTSWNGIETNCDRRKSTNSQWIPTSNELNDSPQIHQNFDENRANSYYNEAEYYDFNSYDYNSTNYGFQALQFDDFASGQQQVENSSESDIIVEESDNNSDFSDDCEGKITNLTKCLLCNVTYTPGVIQFYFLTEINPVTMTSQLPVLKKLKSIIGAINSKGSKYLCRECLGLLNSIDHFQTKLRESKIELFSKFKQTCRANKICYKPQRKTKFRALSAVIRCKCCRRVLFFKNYLKFHLIKHKQGKVLCEKCGKSFNLKAFKAHSCMNTEILVCCDKAFKNLSKLKEHQNFCMGTLPYQCKSCDKKFTTTTKLKNHTKLKHDKKFVAICSICNVGFVKISDYKAHKISHTTDKKYSCKICGKCYKTPSNLNFHMKSHNPKLPFNCTLCSRGFMRKEYLETHLNQHNNVRNFNCTICSKKFTSQKNLDAHFKYHDGSIVKKICNICGKSLTTSMSDHLRIHNNLREFECSLCELKFNTKGTLMKHRKIKHNS